MRERLKSAIARASQLEQELMDLKSNYAAAEKKSTLIDAPQKPSPKSDCCLNIDISNDQGT